MHAWVLHFHNRVDHLVNHLPARNLGELATLVDPEDTQGKPRAPSRDICSMTTLPFGATLEDLSRFEASHLDVPLRAVLKSFSADACEHAVMSDVWMWIDRRTTMGDIMDLDQCLAPMFDDIVQLQLELEDRNKTASSMKQDHDVLEKKLDMAVRAMIARQHAVCKKKFPHKEPEKTDFYNVQVANIHQWKDSKLETSLESQRLFNMESDKMGDKLSIMAKGMVEHAAMLALPAEPEKTEGEPKDLTGHGDVDPELMNELIALVGDTPSTHEAWRIC